MTTRPDAVTALGPDVVMIDDGRGQAYLLRSPDSRAAAVLIDTGLSGYAPLVADALARWGLDVPALKIVLLTHWHPDHAGSAAEIGAWPGTQVWVHEGDAAVVRGDEPGPEPDLTEAEVLPHRRVEGITAPAAHVDRTFSGDGPLDGLPEGIEARVVETPGHTAGSVAFVFGRHGVFVTGDVVANQGGRIVVGPYNVDRARARESFGRLTRGLVDPGGEVRVVCFGHGAPLDGPGVDAVFAATADPHPSPFRFPQE